MKQYQSIEKYKGSLYSPPNRFVGLPEYQGIEYNKNVQDGMVISSPGGTSSITSHYSGGFYGVGGSTNDKFGGDGYRYIYGEFGNLYNVGDSAATYMGEYPPKPDYTFTKNESFKANSQNLKNWQPKELQQSRWAPKKKGILREMFTPNYSNVNNFGTGLGEPNYMAPLNSPYDEYSVLPIAGEQIDGEMPLGNLPIDQPSQQFTQPNSGREPPKKKKSKKPKNEGFELIDESGNSSGNKKKINIKGFVIFIIFLIAYMAMDFWSRSGNKLIALYFGDGQPLSWKKLAIVASVLTAILVIFSYSLDFPLITFEQI